MPRLLSDDEISSKIAEFTISDLITRQSSDLNLNTARRVGEFERRFAVLQARIVELEAKLADETEGNDLLRTENESALMQLAEARATIKAQAEDAEVGKAIREMPEDTYISYRNYLKIIPEWEKVKPWQITRFKDIDDDGKDYEGDSLPDAFRAAGLLPAKAVTE